MLSSVYSIQQYFGKRDPRDFIPCIVLYIVPRLLSCMSDIHCKSQAISGAEISIVRLVKGTNVVRLALVYISMFKNYKYDASVSISCHPEFHSRAPIDITSAPKEPKSIYSYHIYFSFQ